MANPVAPAGTDQGWKNVEIVACSHKCTALRCINFISPPTASQIKYPCPKRSITNRNPEKGEQYLMFVSKHYSRPCFFYYLPMLEVSNIYHNHHILGVNWWLGTLTKEPTWKSDHRLWSLTLLQLRHDICSWCGHRCSRDLLAAMGRDDWWTSSSQLKLNHSKVELKNLENIPNELAIE